MNQTLVGTGLTRIIIPTVFRDDYILALKALSNNADSAPYIRMLNRAAAFSRWLNYHSRETCFENLKRSNALKQPSEAKLSFSA